MINLNKEDIIELFRKETDEFIKENYNTKGIKEMYYVLTGKETKKNKDAVIKLLRSKIGGPLDDNA